MMNKKLNILFFMTMLAVFSVGVVDAFIAQPPRIYRIMGMIFSFIMNFVMPIIFLLIIIWQKKKYGKLGVKRIIINILIFFLVECVTYIVFDWILDRIMWTWWKW